MVIFCTVDIMLGLQMGIGWGAGTSFQGVQLSFSLESELFQEFCELHDIYKFQAHYSGIGSEVIVGQ